jgi:putative phosphoribosyl transferase
MVLHHDAIFQNRQHAAFLLGERLKEYDGANAIVVAVPGGGIHIGSYLAQLLHLPLDVIPCKKIKHPADSHKTIGAVGPESVIVHEEEGNDIPQDYICHQIQMLQHVIKGQIKKYNQGRLQSPFKSKTIILVDDLLMTGDTVMACLKSIKKHSPEKIVVAVPNVTPEATRVIAGEIDEIIYLTIEPNVQHGGNLYTDFPEVSDEEVMVLLQQSRLRNLDEDNA